MKVINQTKKTTLAEEIITPTTLLDRSLGLLKYKTPVAMLLQTRFGIHTFGMRYIIDVVILDKRNHVVAVKENLTPNRIFVWNPKYTIILELPAQTILNTKTNLGDEMKFLK